MTTIQKRIEIPEGRHIRLDLVLPEGFPAGQANALLFISRMWKLNRRPLAGTGRQLERQP